MLSSEAFSPAINFSDPASGTTNIVSNDTVTWNQLGDSTSCTTPTNAMTNTGSPETNQGVCTGILVSSSVNGLTIKNNNFFHLGEGVHLLCYPGSSGNQRCSPGDPGGSGPTTYGLIAQYNDFNQIHRINWEEQPEAISNVVFQYNTSHDWFVPYYGSFGLSMACCANPASFSPYLKVLDNIVVFNTTPAGRYGYGMEAFGNQANYDHNEVQSGTFPSSAEGMAWGRNCCSNIGWSFSFNRVQGSFSGGYIVAEFPDLGLTPPTQTNNITGPTISAITSVAPTIAPSAGSYSFPLTVTLTDAGYGSGATGPTGNTGIWYTTDGSTPVPGSGTAKRLDTGGTFVLPAAATVKAVGMWGALNQPTSYASGYGFVPSSVVSAAYTSSGGTVVMGNNTDNTAGGTYPNTFNDVYAVTGINPAGYTVNTGTVCIAPGTVTNGKNIDIGVNSATTATTEGTTALCHATYTHTSNTSPGCVTVPLIGCGLLSSNTPYWLWTITNDPLGPSPLYFSNCGGTCNGPAPTSPGVGTYSGFWLGGTYGSYAAMSSTFNGQNTGQPSVYLGVTPAEEYGVTTTSVNDQTSPDYFNDVYAITGPSSGGYTVNTGTVCIAPGTVTNGAKTDIGINTAPTTTTEGATALCHATYTNTSSTSPGCVTVPLSGCGTLSPNTPYWLWTITNDPTRSPLYFSNCGGTCSGSAPTSAGVGTYGGFYLHGTYGTYTGMSSAFTGGPSAAQPSVSMSVTPH